MSQLATIGELMRMELDHQRILDTLRQTQLSFEAIALILEDQPGVPATRTRLIAQTAKEQLLTLYEQVR